jgi:hypothetical protein
VVGDGFDFLDAGGVGFGEVAASLSSRALPAAENGLIRRNRPATALAARRFLL